MKAIVLSALILSALAGVQIVENDNEEVMPDAAIEYINSVQNMWVASKEWVGSMTLGVAKTFATTTLKTREFPEYNWGALLNNIQAPTSFDSRTHWPGCVHPILDQGQCGSCWAFGAAEALSDRFCIASKGATSVVLSPQYLVDCDHSSSGCNGGYPDLAWRYMQQHGIPTLTCVPYKAKDGTCPSTCSGGAAPKFYKAASVSTYKGAASIQSAIMAGGPIETAFTVYQDFMGYKSGVYVHTYGNVVGGHAVKMIGWGVSGSHNYWICANSWGTGWGIQGFFWIAFGQCGIDSGAVGGTPSL